MPTLACRICGRVVYTTASLESLFSEEGRCPRCGNSLEVERRVDNRRKTERRQNPPDVPGPPSSFERRTGERRRQTRRRDDNRQF
jgi:hypothetical protein